MPYLVAEPLTLHLLLIAPIGAVMVSCSWMTGAFDRSRRLSLVWVIPHASAAVLVFLAADAWLRDMPAVFTIFPIVLLAVYLGLYVMPSRWSSPRVRFASVALALMGFMGTLRYTNVSDDVDFGPSPDEIALENRISQFRDVEITPFVTDRGRPIHVREFAGESGSTIDRDLREFQKDWLSRNGIRDRIIAMEQVWLPCNCHGYVFADGKNWVPGEEVAAILDDNGYAHVATAEVGDLAVYRDTSGQIVHTGIVRGLATGVYLVESKWGKLGCFVHPHHVFMKSNFTCQFYRSLRAGHALSRRADPAAVGAVKGDAVSSPN